MNTRSIIKMAAVLGLGPVGSVEAAIILANNVPYTQNFDSLASTGTSSTLPADWFISESGTGANTTYSAGTGSGATGDTYSFGSTSSTERALGGLLSGSVVPIFGASFTNDTGAGTIDVTVTYTGEQWRLGTAGRTDRIDFQYSTDATSLTTGTWTNFDLLDFTAPVTAGATGALDGNASANRTAISGTITSLAVLNGASFWIRWTDLNASGADDGLAVDDFSIIAVPEPASVLLGALGLLAILRRRR